MKHIKLFEGYLDKYYEELSYDEWIMNHQSTEINSENSTRVLDFLRYNCNNSEWDITPIKYNGQVTLNSLRYDLDVWIIAVEDDYYYVRYDDRGKYPYGYFYKCDQWEGLIKLLKDKKII